jgi:hypothetical protein
MRFLEPFCKKKLSRKKSNAIAKKPTILTIFLQTEKKKKRKAAAAGNYTHRGHTYKKVGYRGD